MIVRKQNQASNRKNEKNERDERDEINEASQKCQEGQTQRKTQKEQKKRKKQKWSSRAYSGRQIKQSLMKRRRYRGVNDLLTYLIALDDQMVMHKDGALSCYFRYVAPDLSACTDAELDFHASTWAKSFEFLGNGWMVETNVISQRFAHYHQGREFPDIVSALIDDERRLQYQQGAYYRTEYYLSITWKPEQLMAPKLRQFALQESKSTPTTGQLEACIQQFKKVVMTYTGFLKRSLVSLTPLSGDDLTTFLYRCLTRSHQSLKKPYLGAFLDCYLSNCDFEGGLRPKMGDQWIKVLTLDDLPYESTPCLLDRLSYFPIDYRWSSRFIPLDITTARQYLKRYERSWSSKAIGALGVIRESLGMPAKRDQDAQHMADLLKEAQVHNNAGHTRYGFYNSNLIVMHHDPEYLQQQCDALMEQIQQMNFRVRDESINAVEVYLGSLPGHGDYNLRKMLVDTDYIGHALPTSSVYQGEPEAPCQKKGYQGQPPLLFTATSGCRPFMLNCHVDDVGHTAILGPTGKGKSTLNAMIMASHRQYPGSRIIVLDKDRSNWLPIKAMGGDYFDLNQGECQLGVLARVDAEHLHTIDQAVEWLMDCCLVQGVEITPSRQAALREAVERLSHEDPVYKNLNHLSIQEPLLREAIGAFNRGQFQQLLNGTSPLLCQNSILGFDMGDLVPSELKERDLCVPVIKAIFNELEILFQDQRPTLLILEEAWLYLRHRLFREKLTDWFKTLRKKNVAVIFISQDLDDIVKSEAASTIQTSCMTRIYLPNAQATELAVAAQYQAFGLNDQEIQLLQQATPKQDYYYHSEKGSRLFRLDLGPLAQSFLCMSEREDYKQFEAIYQYDDPNWVLEWLAYCEQNDWVEFAKQHYFDTQDVSYASPSSYSSNATVSYVHDAQSTSQERSHAL